MLYLFCLNLGMQICKIWTCKPIQPQPESYSNYWLIAIGFVALLFGIICLAILWKKFCRPANSCIRHEEFEMNSPIIMQRNPHYNSVFQ